MDNIFNNDDQVASVDYYKVIGCTELSSIEQITAEYRNRAVVCHPDKNCNHPDATEEFAQLQAAKEVLTDPQKRKDYDLWRNSGLRIPYLKWKSMRDSVKTAMHWSIKKQEPMLKYTDTSDESAGQEKSNCSEYDNREELRRKFRNYEI